MALLTTTKDPASIRAINKVSRILYVAGPGDVMGTYRHWRENRQDPSQVALTYSGQFYDVCKELDVEAVVICHFPGKGGLVDGPFDIRYRRMPLTWARGPLYHLGQYWFNLRAVCSALSHGCDLIIASSGSHLWPYSIASMLGIRVVLTEHSVIWPKRGRPRGLRRFVQSLDRFTFQRGCDAIICVSKDISRQIEELTGAAHVPIVQFLPTYLRSDFEKIIPANPLQRPFRVLFAGRMEEDKGIFDLIEIASRLNRNNRNDIVFDVAGDGGALAQFRSRVDSLGIGRMFNIHGYCLRHQMEELFRTCHAVIVPTKSQFVEGFNKVVVEAVLSQRPYIASSVCPAVEYVNGAGIEVSPDNIAAYADAIVALADAPQLYREKVAACDSLRETFFDPQFGWAAALKSVLLNLS